MAEERKRPSLHDHSSSTRPSSMRDERPRDPREKKTPGDMKGGTAQLASRHEKAIAGLWEKQEREKAGAPRWRNKV
jgi:hypothetical protein